MKTMTKVVEEALRIADTRRTGLLTIIESAAVCLAVQILADEVRFLRILLEQERQLRAEEVDDGK